MKDLFKAIRSYCEAHADPARAARYERYFVEGYDAYGLDHKAPSWQASIDQWAAELRKGSVQDLIRLGRRLVQSGKYEEASFAILLGVELKEWHTAELFDGIATWFDGGIRNWAHTDVLCGELLPGLLLKQAVPLQSLLAWVGSPHKYQRRAVPVTMIKLLKQFPLKDLLEGVEPLMTDGEKVVQQGAGWFLRELWKLSPALVEVFLQRHREHAPRLIVQYATEKMTPAQKQKFRRTPGAARRPVKEKKG